jgi:hypothetical protein
MATAAEKLPQRVTKTNGWGGEGQSGDVWAGRPGTWRGRSSFGLDTFLDSADFVEPLLPCASVRADAKSKGAPTFRHRKDPP